MLKARQTIQPEFEDRLSLRGRQTVTVVDQAVIADQVIGPGTDRTGALEHRVDLTGLPDLRDEGLAGLGRGWRGLDQRDDLVDVGERDGLPFEDMSAGPCLDQFVDRTAGNDFSAVLDEGIKHLLQVQQPRLAVAQRDHIDAEHAFHLCVFVQIVQYDIGDFAAAQFDDDAHAILVPTRRAVR